MQVTMWRKGIDHPTVIREYIEETIEQISSVEKVSAKNAST